MTITEQYDINKILVDIEVALCIDGKDYAEKDVDTIFESIYNRIIRQYQLDLRNRKITDADLYVGKARPQAVLFVENISALHGRLCGYLQIARYHKQVTIKPSNINYMGFSDTSFKSFLIAAQAAYTQSSIDSAVRAIKGKFGTINSCTEKKLILIMLVSHALGFGELVASIAEIMYLGMMI